MKNLDFNESLKECENSSAKGLSIAKHNFSIISNTLEALNENIEHVLVDFNNSSYENPEISNLLNIQQHDIQGNIYGQLAQIQNELSNIEENPLGFSITLFGRTMAGKSTLMEILTKGNGDSIGNGSQRTTKDIRKYKWKNLSITDVPGIGAFEGEDDENIALSEVKHADLILFLLSNDGVQSIEADFFSELVTLGKPILCVMNVKASISNNPNMKLATRDIGRAFNNAKLSELKKQFVKYADNYNQDWSKISFVDVHLLSAFRAKHTEDEVLSLELYKLSRFEKLEEKISEIVQKKGKYYSIKTSVDIVTNPLIDNINRFKEHSLSNKSIIEILDRQIDELKGWNKENNLSVKKRINDFIDATSRKMLSEVSAFTDDFFDSPDANEEWSKVIQRMHVEEDSKALLDQFTDECVERRKEFSRRIEKELKPSVKIKHDRIKEERRIINIKGIYNTVTAILSGAFLLGGVVADFADQKQIGKILKKMSVVVGAARLGGELIDDPAVQERESKERFQNALTNTVNGVIKDLRKSLEINYKKVNSQYIGKLISQMMAISKAIKKLENNQSEYSAKLNDILRDINYEYATSVIPLISDYDWAHEIKRVGRIPGRYLLISIENGTAFKESDLGHIEDAISEKVIIIHHTDNKSVLLKRILHEDKKYEITKSEIKIPARDLAKKNMTDFLELFSQLSGLSVHKV